MHFRVSLVFACLFTFVLQMPQLISQSCTTCYDNCLLDSGESFITCGSFNPSDNSVAITQQLDGNVLGIFNTNDPGANGGVLGDNWTSVSGNATVLDPAWDAQNLGEVFGITSAANLNSGCHDLYVTQFGHIPGGLEEGGTVYQGDLATSCNGGAVYKIDGVTGVPTLFACLPSVYGDLPAEVFNSIDRFYLGTYETYTGLGQITYNKDCDVFYVSNFNDGLIYVLDASGNTIGTYDFGAAGLPALVTNNGSAGYLDPYLDGNDQIIDDPADALTQWQRRVFGVGYNPKDGHLYFGLIRNSSPNDPNNRNTRNVDQYVIQVMIDPNTCLPIASTTDLALEIDQGNRSPVSDIHFDVNNNMLLGEMTTGLYSNKDAHYADMLLVQGGVNNWSISEVINTSPFANGGGLAGGVDFGYNNYGSNPDTGAGNCPEESLVYSVDAAQGINNPKIYGFGVVPFMGGNTSNAYLVDADGDLGTRDKYTNNDIEVISPQCNLTSLNLVCTGAEFTVKPDCVQDIICDYTITVNQGTITNTRTNSTDSGSPCLVETFEIVPPSATCGAFTVDVTVTINTCDGSKPCTLTESVTCSVPTPTCSVDIISQPTCENESAGSISVTSTGGTTPYTYLWSTGSTNSVLTGLSAGDYTVTVTDENGCTTICTNTLVPPDDCCPEPNCAGITIVRN